MKGQNKSKSTTKTTGDPIQNIISDAEQPKCLPDNYANHVQTAITNSEIYLDFYCIAPLYTNAGVEPVATHVQRTVIPLTLGKGLVSALANSIANFEKDNDITLPNTRGQLPNDLVDIWK